MKLKKLLLSISVCAIFISAWFVISYYVTFRKPNTKDKTEFLYVHRGATYKDLTDSLFSLDVIKNEKSFNRAAKRLKLSSLYKPGRYKISFGMSNKQIINNIILNNEEPVKLVIAGSIRSKIKLAQIIDKKNEMDYEQVFAIINSDSVARSYGFNEQTFISMFMPNTYEIYWTSQISEILSKLKREYDRFWNSERVAKAKKAGFTQTEISTLASIVYEESKAAQEQPVIAGVYINRLRRGMPLQADPTVVFANNDFTIRRVLGKHLRIDSPYNTYKYKGLPPGPISVPPASVIDSVLNYRHHNYIYFCASPAFDGTHLFAATGTEHMRNAAAYRRALNKRSILK